MFKEVASQLKGKTLEEGRFCKGHLVRQSLPTDV